MPRKWKLLPLGTRIRLMSDKGNIDAYITEYLADKNKEIKGYLAKSDDDPPTLIALAFDDEFEVLG